MHPEWERLRALCILEVAVVTKAWKLFEVDARGNLYSLFIDKKPLQAGQWLKAKHVPTKGFAVRSGWHCVRKRFAPHLKINPVGKRRRVWLRISIREITQHLKPASQGGLWFTAKYMRIENCTP